eukprot:jgi/Mesvir1/8095/Mv11205-RA.1
MGIKARDEMGKIVVKPDTSAVAAPAAPVVETKSRKRTRRSAAKTEVENLDVVDMGVMKETPRATTAPSPSPAPAPAPALGSDVEPFSIPNTLAESHIAFLRRKADGAVHVGALLSALGAKSEDVFGTDSSWIAPETVVKAMKSDKRMRPLHEAFSESIAVLEDLEADKENDVPFRCVDFLKARYGHGNFDATHLIQFGGRCTRSTRRRTEPNPPPAKTTGTNCTSDGTSPSCRGPLTSGLSDCSVDRSYPTVK